MTAHKGASLSLSPITAINWPKWLTVNKECLFILYFASTKAFWRNEADADAELPFSNEQLPRRNWAKNLKLTLGRLDNRWVNTIKSTPKSLQNFSSKSGGFVSASGAISWPWPNPIIVTYALKASYLFYSRKLIINTCDEKRELHSTFVCQPWIFLRFHFLCPQPNWIAMKISIYFSLRLQHFHSTVFGEAVFNFRPGPWNENINNKSICMDNYFAYQKCPEC